MSQDHSLRVLLCVYSCAREPYNSLRKELTAHPWFTAFQSLPNVETLYVFADPQLDAPQKKGDILTLPCAEDYLQLSMKTWHLMDYCAKHEQFDLLIKIDDSILHNDLIAYYLKKPLARLITTRHYNGPVLSIAKLGGLHRWMKQKAIAEGKYDIALFPHFLPFFAGKTYALSRRAVSTVAEQGREYAEKYLERIWGLEDIMISEILHRHLLSPQEKLLLRIRAAAEGIASRLQTSPGAFGMRGTEREQ